MIEQKVNKEVAHVDSLTQPDQQATGGNNALASALKLAKEATNALACVARRKIDHDEVARLHREIAALDRPPDHQVADISLRLTEAVNAGLSRIVQLRRDIGVVIGILSPHVDPRSDVADDLREQVQMLTRWQGDCDRIESSLAAGFPSGGEAQAVASDSFVPERRTE